MRDPAGTIAALRSGAWMTRERARLVCLTLLVFYALSTAFLFATSNGRVDRFGRPLGTDFSEVWTAGLFVREGHPEKPFDPAVHAARQGELFAASSGFFAWSYPPYFLAVAALFALFPYALALVLWQGATLPLYLWVTSRIVAGREALLAAAAFPAVFVNIGHGHNGFLSAALMGGGLLLLERRPWLAGVLFGLLAYKPQFGLMIPLALLAGGCWRAIGGAALAVAAMTLASLAVFGPDVWTAFFASTEFSRRVIVEEGATGFQKIQTAFAAVRLWGGSVALAYAAQAVVAVICAAALAALWRWRADWRLRGAALMICSLLATPYALDYDMMLLGPAIAMTAAYGMERGFLPWEKTLLAVVWATPILARVVTGLTFVPLGFLAMAAFLGLVLRRALTDAGAAAQVRGWLAAHGGLAAQVRAFLLVGCLGFAIDAGLTVLLSRAGLSPYLARPPAALIAIASTWTLNRRFTFRPGGGARLAEFGRYLSVSAAGLALNYALYSAVLAGFGRLAVQAPAPAVVGGAVATGSLGAMALTFFGFRAFAFRAGNVAP
jgi:putative flippase GtrA